MKLTSIILLTFLLHVTAATKAQQVTLKADKITLKELFKQIRKQTGYDILFQTGTINANTTIKADFNQTPLKQVMEQSLQGQQLEFVIDEKTVIIKKKEAQPEQQAPKPPTDITGQLTNKQGEPLVGATILIKRTKTGTMTDVKGNFTLRGVYTTDTLILSYIGYKSLHIAIGNKTVFDEVMQETNNSLDAVVIQAYGQTTQRLATGNIATVTAKEIESQPVMNPLLALQGKVPGLVVSQTSGYASAPVKVEIRGRAQIDGTLPSEPLFIIDGVPLTILENPNAGGTYGGGSVGFTQGGMTGPAGGQSPFFSINPEDIESITVLKDADATAVYGSRGANGVIIINTKKGKAGKTITEVNAYEGISKVTNHYNMLNTQQYVAMRQEAFKNDGITPNVGNAYDLLTWDTKRYTDWQKYAWGSTGKTTDADMSLSGGDKQTTFRINGAYHRETDITTVSGANQKSSLQFNFSHKSLDQRLGVSLTGAYSYASIENIIGLPNVATLPPNAPAVFATNGVLNWAEWNPGYNPFSVLLDPYNSNTGFLNSRFGINYQLAKSLSFEMNLGYSAMNNGQHFIQPITSQDPNNNPQGSAQFGNNALRNLIGEPQLNYKTLLSKGTLDATLGGSLQSVSANGSQIQGNGYTDDNFLNSISNAPSVYTTDFSSEYKYSALFARINYNWEDKYIINFSARRDGSSRFGSGKQFGNFGAIGAAWIFTQEGWAKDNLSFLSFGKLRGSYGTTGSDNIGNYQFLTNWSSAGSTPYIQNNPVYNPQGHANPDLQWQVNKKLEIALNLGFLDDRLTLEVVRYRNRISNQLVSYPLSIISGFNQVTANLPATVQNSGWESTISAKIVNQKDFQWSMNFDIGFNKNILVSFPGIAQTAYASTDIIGQSLSIKKLLHYVGIDPQTGQYLVEDKNHDGQLNINGASPSNDLYPTDLAVKFEGGFGTDFRYKNLDLSLFFRFRKQTILSPLSNIGSTAGKIANYPVDVLNRWEKPGDQSQLARFTTSNTISDIYYTYSDALYVDGSYIRLQNLALSYNLPSTWLRKAKIQNLKLFVYGENLFIITPYKGIDPDTPGFGGMPPAKALTIGVKFNL